MLCVDEFGPISLKPESGSSWCKEKHPDRVPATYHKTQGVQHLLAAYDIKRDRLFGHMQPRKRHNEFLAFLKHLRRKYSTQRLYIIMDNFSPHLHSKVQGYCEQHNIRIELTPTNASWLNRIECHFNPLKEFALKNCNYESRQEQAKAVQQYLCWRNKNKKHPKILKLQKRNNYA